MLNRPLLSRALLIALFSAPMVVAVTDSAPAAAQGASLFANSSGMVHLLSPSAVVGDGSSTATLFLLALNPDGSPMTGLKGRIGADQGGTSDLKDQGNGLYSFDYTPPMVSAATKVSFSLKAKTAAKVSMDKDFALWVNPPLPAQLTVSSSPTELVLGQDQGAALNIRLTGPNGETAADGGQLLVNTEYGSVESLTYLGGGAWTARYVPKAVNYPHLDVVTFADARDPSKVYGTHVVSMVGKTNFPISDATPNSTVMLRIGERDFGPYQADTQGKVSIPVTVPPGIPTATRITIVNGEQRQEPFDLQLPKTRRLALFPMATVPGDGETSVPVRIAVRTPEGKADGGAKVSLSSTSGKVSQPVHEGNGIYRADFTPSRSAGGETVTLSASVAGEASKSELQVQVAPALPNQLKLTAEPTQLSAGATGFKVYAKLTDPAGIGIEGAAPAFVVAGAKASGAPRDLKSGDYQSSFSTTGADSVLVTALALGAPSGNPMSRVVVLPSSERVTNDGRSTVVVSVLSVDQFGYPVPDQPVTLRVNAGDGRLPSEVRTDARGLATVTYAAGRTAGPVDIEAKSGGLYGSATLLQVPASVDIDLPASGSASVVSQDERLARLVQTVLIPREGASGVALATMDDTSGTVGTVTTLEVAASPAEVAPGGSVTINITARDQQGRAVADEDLKVLATGGVMSAVQKRGGGSYSATLTVNADASGDAMVVVTSANGKVSQALPVPIAANLWGSAPEAAVVENTTPEGPAGAAPETTPVAPMPPPPEPPTAPKAEGEFPNGRVRVAGVFGSYDYRQAPTENPSALWNDAVNVATGIAGFEVDGYGYLPKLPYLGAEAQFRMGLYSLVWPGTSEEQAIGDQVPRLNVSVLGRLPFQVGDNQLHVGARAGYLYGDFITYQQGATETQLNYDSVGLPGGWTLGGELGAQFSQRAHMRAVYTAGFNQVNLYDHSVMVDLGVRPSLDLPLSLVGSFQYTARDIEVVTAGDGSSTLVGTLEDTQLLGTVGVAYEF